MSSIFFSDILVKAQIDPKDVLLIRHPLSNKYCRRCFEDGYLLEYTRLQKSNFTKEFKYWAIFVGNSGSMALYKGLFKMHGVAVNESQFCPKGFPFPEMYDGECVYFDLEELDALGDLKDRLMIDWGQSARMWHQRATNEKAVVAIQRYQREIFPGYEKVVLGYNELSEILEDDITYSDWHTALSSIYAVYLITDTSNGKQYIGSAYGKDGLLGRWRIYIATGHGHTKEMTDILNEKPEQYKYFQFSILQILPKNLSDDEVIKIESLYKDKLLTRQFGMNSN